MNIIRRIVSVLSDLTVFDVGVILEPIEKKDELKNNFNDTLKLIEKEEKISKPP